MVEPPAVAVREGALPPDDRTARWWLGIIAAIVSTAVTVVGIRTTARTLKLFQSPPTDYSNGFVAIGFAGQPGSTNIPVSIEEDIDASRGSDSVEYKVRFPAAARGKRWALFLAGDAALTGAFAGYTDQDGMIPVKTIACGQLGTCQLLQGQLSTNLVGASEAQDQFCASNLASPPSVEVLVVAGTRHLVRNQSGGRKSILVPGDPELSRALNDTARDPDFHGIDPVYQSSDVTYCKRVKYPSNLETTIVTPTPQHVAEGEVGWLTTQKRGVATVANSEALTLSPTNLASKENFGIVLIGIEFALLCSFLPVLVECIVRGMLGWHQRRRSACEPPRGVRRLTPDPAMILVG